MVLNEASGALVIGLNDRGSGFREPWSYPHEVEPPFLSWVAEVNQYHAIDRVDDEVAQPPLQLGQFYLVQVAYEQ